MSNIDRDLAREAALRVRYRRAGCPDPKCDVCGEEKVWRLAFKKGLPPICRNCLADRTRDRTREENGRTRAQKAGFSEPRCIVCGEDRFWRLEFDHIAGQNHDATSAPLCTNCHADRTFLQSTEPKGGENPKNVLEVIGRWLLGIAEWFELILDTLYLFGEYLIGLARNGYGTDLKLPR